MEDEPNGRSYFEKWLDKHNHKMAFLRTVMSTMAAVFGALVTLKVFGIV